MHDLKQFREYELVLLEGVYDRRKLVHFSPDGLVIKLFVSPDQGVDQLFRLLCVECAVVVGVKRIE